MPKKASFESENESDSNRFVFVYEIFIYFYSFNPTFYLTTPPSLPQQTTQIAKNPPSARADNSAT